MEITLSTFLSFVSDLKGTSLRTIGEGNSFTIFSFNDCTKIILENGEPKTLTPPVFQKCASIFNATGSYTTTDYLKVTGLSSYVLSVFRAMQGVAFGGAPVVVLKWKRIRTTDILPLDWFKEDFPLKGVIHEMRSPRGKVSGQAKCDVTKDGLVAILDYRPIAFRKFNDQNDVECGLVRLTFGDPERTSLLKFEWQGIEEDTFSDGRNFQVIYELPPAPPYIPPKLPASKVAQLVRPRPGQALFKKTLSLAYQGRCCVTRCDVAEVLEAAHIDDYIAPESHHVGNGLLLRSDIHALFDTNLLAIEPVTKRIHISQTVNSANGYTQWHGREIFPPSEVTHRPNLEALRRRWEKFKSAKS